MSSKETIPKSCCTVEVGTKIFAYFNLVLSSVSSLVFLINLLYSLIVGLFLPLVHKQPMLNNMPMIVVAAISFDMLIVSLKSLCFAALLICGVQKKKPEYIKVYFIYGVIIVVLLGLMSVVFIVCGVRVVTVIVLLVSTFYSLILVMIWKTYKKYEMMDKQLEHKQLNEKV